MRDDPIKCSKCDQDVVLRGWFWVLATELLSARATFCPAGGVHETDEGLA